MYHLVKLLIFIKFIMWKSLVHQQTVEERIGTYYMHLRKTPVFKSKKPCTKLVGEADTSIRNGVGKEKGEEERKEKAIQAKAERIETPNSKYP